MTETEELKKTIGVGLDVEAFFSTNAGSALCAKLASRAEEAVTALVAIDPTDTEGIRRLQNRIRCARDFRFMLIEMIDEGANAELQLRNPDDGEDD